MVKKKRPAKKEIAGSVAGTTGRKQAEEALQESRERYRRITEGLTDYFYTVRLQDGQVVETTHGQACEVVTGYTKEEFADNPNLWMNMVVAEERDQVLECVQRILAGENIPPIEHRIVRKDGQIRWISDIPILQFDPQGRLISYDGVIKDITTRKRAEEVLWNSEARFRTLYENAPVLIDGFDNSGRCTLWNQECEKVFGWTMDEINSQDEPLALFYPDPDIRREVIDSVTSQPGNIFREWHSLTKDGKELTVLWANFQLPDGMIINIGHDITERKRLEEEQQRVEKLESVGLLAGGIAHNFNNVLTSILGNISLARTEAAPGSQIHESLEQAEKAALRAKDLTVQLLTFSKGGAPVKKLASLPELLRDIVSFALSSADVKCQFSLPADLWHAEVDAGQVSQAIHNLIINAQQAMPAGGSIEITAENIALSKKQSLGRGLPVKAGNYVRIAVADHGTGIPGENLEKIFDPFFTTKPKGSGLGLATAFSIARQHGGHLSVESKVGSGSTFYLYLPASAPKQAIKDQVKPAVKARILVMDDEQGVREVAGRMLKHIGYEDVECAADGAEAIKLYKASMKSGHPFGVAILDLTIPGGMGGEVTIQKLLDIDPGVKAIVSSGYIDDPVMAEFSAYGFSGMVAKPYTLEELRKAVQDVIG